MIGKGVASRILGQRSGKLRFEQGHRVVEDKRRRAGINRLLQRIKLSLRHRGGKHHEQDIQIIRIWSRRGDLSDFVLLAKFGDDGPVRGAGHGLEVEPAEQLGIGGDDAELLALGLHDHAYGTDQFVFHRQAAVKERNDELLGAGGEHQPEKDLPRRALAGRDLHQRARDDVVIVRSFRCVFGVRLRVVNHNLNPIAAQSIQAMKRVEKILVRTHITFRNVRTEKRLNEDRAVVGNLIDQGQTLRLEGVQTLRRDIGIDAGPFGKNEDGDDHDGQGSAAGDEVDGVGH